MTNGDPLVNPYVAGNPITGEEMFFGREDVFEFVRQTLIGQHQDNIIVLHGQRRTGKTSVLYQIQRQMDPQYVPILIDLQALTMEGTATFLWEIASTISRTLRREHNVEIERPRPEDFTQNPRGFFQDDFLNRVFESIGDRHLLLMFDESVRLEDQVLAGRLERDIFDYLRHLMQHIERLGFIFSLGSRLEEIHRDYGVLFSVALYKKISFLDATSARRLITDPVRGIYEYDDEAVDYILEVGGRHPYYTQLICHGLFSRYAGKTQMITSKEVSSILPEAVERCTPVLKFVWDQSSEPEMIILSVMADWMSDNNVPMNESGIQQALKARQIVLPDREFNPAIRGLINKEALINENGYKFSVDLLRLYLRENQRIEWVREDLRRYLEQFDGDETFIPEPRKRSRLLKSLSILIFIAIITVAVGTLLSPASPLPYMFSIMSTSSTPTPVPTVFPPAQPTATSIQPTATPIGVLPEPGIFVFSRCGLPSVGGEELAKLKLCVESVEVNQRGEMRFNISWEAQIQEGLEVDGRPVDALQKESDLGSTQMYLTDNIGNRYDFFDLGGAALETTIIPNGSRADGWYLFPPPIDQARNFTFHDDDNFWAIAGIILE